MTERRPAGSTSSMVSPTRLAFVALVLLASACGDAPTPPPPRAAPVAPIPAPRAARPEPEPAAPALRDDRGGWDPPGDMVALAARLGDPAAKAAALAELGALPRARRIDVLRAGLRLRDDAAARACAARLEWPWIDGWECARCVDLLVGDVLRPESEASFEELRSYLGSVDLPRIFAEAPPLPWSVDPPQVAGQMHRLIRPQHAELFLLPDARLPEECRVTMAKEWFATAWRRTDSARDVVQRHELGADPPAAAVPGLPPTLRAWWTRASAWTPDLDEKPLEAAPWDVRWMFESPLSADDSAMLCDALGRLHPRDPTRDLAALLLGKARDERSDLVLRLLIEDGDLAAYAAKLALARRGDPAWLAWAESDALEDEDRLATLMEAAPARARSLLDSVLLGADDDAAHRLLGRLERFVVPGAMDVPAGRPDWRRTSFDGLEGAVAAAERMQGLRRARIGVVVPGCRTRRVAEAACEGLADADLDGEAQRSDEVRSWVDLQEIGAFLETAAPGALRAALRRIAAGRAGGGRDTAVGWLLAMGDPPSASLLVAEVDRVEDVDGPLYALARTASPLVRADLERRVKSAQASGDGDELRAAVTALAVFHGLPEDARSAFDTDLSDDLVGLVVAGKPTDAVVAIVAPLLDDPDPEDADTPGPDSAWRVGSVRDPRIAAWLHEVRRRRDLNTYWWATSQLAAAGDAAARAEYWRAITDGRYRILDDEGDEFGLTLGWDLPATVPHWIAELETNCCRANVAAGVLEDTIGFREGSTDRTDASRAREMWDAADGRFVRSRIAGHWVPEAR